MAHVTADFQLVEIAQATGIVDFTVNVGTGSDRAIQITFARHNTRFPAVTSVVLDPAGSPEAFEVQGIDTVYPSGGINSLRSACLLGPTLTGSQTLRITFTTDDSDVAFCFFLMEVIDGIDTGQTVPTPTVATGDSTEASVTRSSATGNQIVPAFAYIDTVNGPDGSNVTNYTERASLYDFQQGFSTGDAAGATSVTLDCEWTDGGTPVDGAWVATAVDFAPTGGGPSGLTPREYPRGAMRGVMRGAA